jgi:hypothetical protein
MKKRAATGSLQEGIRSLALRGVTTPHKQPVRYHPAVLGVTREVDQLVDQSVASPGYVVPREQSPPPERIARGRGTAPNESGPPPLAASRFSVLGRQHHDRNQSRRALLVAGVPRVGGRHEGPEPVVLLGGRGPRRHL